MKDLIKQAENMALHYSFGRMLVLRPFKREYKGVKAANYSEIANYRNTGLALCGVLKYGQVLDDFRAEWIDRKAKRLE